MKREIVHHDNPAVHEKAREVKLITPEVKALVKEMLQTMRDAPGVGLAANQIGVLERVVVIELPEEEDEPMSGRPLVLINPEIVGGSGTQVGQEACLSVPGYTGEVQRFEEVTVRAQAENGRTVTLKAHGFFARVLQHEIDHLDGVLYVDRLTSPDRLYRVEDQEETVEE